VPQATSHARRERSAGGAPVKASTQAPDIEPLRGLEQYRLEWLISFVAAARHGGVSAAARALYRSQPRVSSHVAELEQALGVQLFDRSARPVRLTHDGRALLVRAEEILDAVRGLSETAGGSSPKELCLVTEASVAAYAYPILAMEIAALWPSTRLALSEVASSGELAGGSWDLAIAPALQAGLPFAVDSVALWSEPLVAVLRPDHALARPGVPVTLSSLSGTPVIRQQPGSVKQGSTVRSAAMYAGPVQPQTLISMVRHGMGVGLLGGLAAMSANSDGVVLKPVADPQCARSFSLCWPQRRFGGDDRLIRTLAARIPEPVWPWSDVTVRLAAATG